MPTDVIIAISIVLSIYTFIILYKGMVIIPEHKIGIIEKFGAYHRIVEPGIHFMFPLRDRVVIMSLDDKISFKKVIVIQEKVTFDVHIEVHYHVDQIVKFAYGKAPDQIVSRLQKHIKEHHTENEADIDLKSLMTTFETTLIQTHDTWGITIHEINIITLDQII